MRLYLVRHPEPIVTPDTCYGSSDLDVTAEQCERVNGALCAILPKDAVLFSSPLRRCMQLAQRLASELGQIPVIYDERLVEMHYGRWELRAWNDIPQAEMDAWMTEMVTYCPGDGESVLQMAARVYEFYDELLRTRHDTAVVICHAGTIRLLLGCQRGLPVVEIARYAAQFRNKIAYGEVFLLDIDENSFHK